MRSLVESVHSIVRSATPPALITFATTSEWYVAVCSCDFRLPIASQECDHSMTRYVLVGLVWVAFLLRPATAVDLVWADNLTGQILRGTVGSAGPAQVLFDIGDYPRAPATIAPLGIAVDDSYVYWSDITTGQILRGSLDGAGMAQVLFDINDYPNAPPQISPAGLAVSNGQIYWADSATGEILRGSIDGAGSAISLHGVGDYPGSPTENYPWGVAIAGGTVYWSDSDTSEVLRGSIDGSGPAELVFASNDDRVNQGLAVNAGFVFWGDVETDQLQGRILRGPLSGAGLPEVLFEPSDYPGSPTSILPVSVAASGGMLYWSDTLTRQILSGAQDGSGPASVLFDIASYPGSPTSIRPGFIAVVNSPYDADFDNDGDVDGRDFLVWQRGASPNPMSAGDLALWKAQFGTAGLAADFVAVPEPCGFTIAILTAAFSATARRSRLSKSLATARQSVH